jgi:hypothetical protein
MAGAGYLPAEFRLRIVGRTLMKLQELVIKDYPFTRGLSKPGHRPDKDDKYRKSRSVEMLSTATQ